MVDVVAESTCNVFSAAIVIACHSPSNAGLQAAVSACGAFSVNDEPARRRPKKPNR